MPQLKTIQKSSVVTEPQKLVAGWSEFASYLTRKHLITGNLFSNSNSNDFAGKEKRLRELWELTELSANGFADEVAQFYKLSRITLPEIMAATPQLSGFSHRFLRDLTLFPCHLQHDDANVVLVLADPTEAVAIRAAKIVLGERLALAVASFEDIATALSGRLGDDDTKIDEVGSAATARHEDDIDSLRDLASGAPVVRALNDLLEKALELRATDIHIEPFRTGLTLRIRIDGLLKVLPISSDILPQALISRVKIVAGLNIAERRLPQDGAAHLRIARSDVDIRVATMPSQYGESAVIRLLPRDRGILEISKLGFTSADQNTLCRLLELPHGMIVVTGPTGSGKTTTLATLLTRLNKPTRKILTIEDPVEYEIAGINQAQVKPEIGLTFAAALRAFVRQDPDVIMVGEIRDAETAHIAIHAALTGHLVLTTLHTESAAAAVPRLLDLGVENFLLQSTLRAVVAQRLVRVLCNRCKAQQKLQQSMFDSDPRYSLLGFEIGQTVHDPAGCDHCSMTGYRGRTGLFEVMEVTQRLRRLIASQCDADSIARSAREAGMRTMFQHGITKCQAGLTSAAEVLRVAAAN